MIESEIFSYEFSEFKFVLLRNTYENSSAQTIYFSKLQKFFLFERSTEEGALEWKRKFYRKGKK